MINVCLTSSCKYFMYTEVENLFNNIYKKGDSEMTLPRQQLFIAVGKV